MQRAARRKVPCSWFFVLGLVGSFGPEEIGDEGTDFGAGLAGEIVETLELIGINVFLVQCDIEFALDLRTGTLRIPEEFDELLVATVIKTFGNVVHDGTGGTLNLVFESEVPDELLFLFLVPSSLFLQGGSRVFQRRSPDGGPMQGAQTGLLVDNFNRFK